MKSVSLTQAVEIIQPAHVYTCPNCRTELTKRLAPRGIFWACDHCGGQTMAVAILRQMITDAAMVAVWTQTFRPAVREGRPCPLCAQAMKAMDVPSQGDPMPVEICQRCDFIWFDHGEFERLPERPVRHPGIGNVDRLSQSTQSARELVAMEKVRKIGEEARAAERSPDATWKTLPALFGMPVEMDAEGMERTPWATYLTTLVIAIISIAAFFNLHEVVEAWGLIPAEDKRNGGLTLLTGFFLHTGWFHLLGNLYFLVVFGRRVEDYLGWRRWLLLLGGAGLTGQFLHILANIHSTVPCIGASGGISGLLAFYALKFPRARLGLLFFYFRWIRVPAWGAFALWIALQIWGAYRQIYSVNHVSSMAHLGGVAAGVYFWYLWRDLHGSASSRPGVLTGQR